MNTEADTQSIFKKGSTTYYAASRFFPSDIREDVTTLYAYVRTADDLVDSIPQKNEEFYKLREETFEGLHTGNSSDPIINGFVHVSEKYSFRPEWIEAFLNSMEADLSQQTYETFDDLQPYIYGSAEVIGLMLASVMKLPEKSYESAQLFGRGMQFLNFIRDICEDIDLGRTYMPLEDMRQFGITDFSQYREGGTSKEFTSFIRYEIKRCLDLLTEAEKGFSYIPRRYRIAIQTTCDMHRWTAEQIYKNPEVIFQRKVKPSKYRVFLKAFLNTVKA